MDCAGTPLARKPRTITTSSGVSAGIDMALGWIAGQYGIELARRIAEHTEYRWAEDPHDDPFAVDSQQRQ